MEKPSAFEELWFRVRSGINHAAPFAMLVLLAIFAMAVFNLATVYNLPPSRTTLQTAILHTAIGAVTLFLLWQTYLHHLVMVKYRVQSDYDHELRYYNRSRLIALFAEGLTVANGEHAAFRQGLDDYAKLLIRTNNSWPVDRATVENSIHRSTTDNSTNAETRGPSPRSARAASIEIVDAERPE